MKKSNKLWFRRKTYGWGWTPITWEGWFATAMLFVVPLTIRFSLKGLGIPRDAQYFYAWASAPILFMVLTLLCFRFGEKPKWQWGIKRTKLAHIDLFVSNYKESVKFYDTILMSLGWEKLVSQPTFTSYTDETLKIVIRPADKTVMPSKLNFLTFYAETREIVDDFYREILIKNQILPLGNKMPAGDKSKYTVAFKDPDGLELRYMFSPFYCEREFSENILESTYDPYI